MDLEMLNRLRVNAGKPELAAWKASKVKLAEAIKSLQAAGFTDALPGANIQAKPVTDDPVVAKVLPKEEEPEIRKNPEDRKEPKKSKLHPAIKSVTSDNHKTEEIKPEPKKEPTVTNGKAKLGRGLENEPMARQSRIAVQMERDREKRQEQAARKEAKATEKAEKKTAKPDKVKKPKKTNKAEKKSAPAKAPKNENEVTVADICRELDIDPKIGRAKLRRHKDKLAKLYAKGVTEGWTFPKGAKAELINILK
jgi:hypothetical protein